MCLLEQIVLPRVEGVYGQGVIKGVVQRAKAVDRVRVTPKGRMDGDGPRGMVGQLVLSKRQNMLGVIVGWDYVFSAQSCGEL